MELSDELLEQIGAYLAGQLSDEEKDRFEHLLQQNPDLRQEVAIQREIKLGLAFLTQKDRFAQMHADLDKRGLLTETSPTTETNLKPLPIDIPLLRYGWASWAMAASLVLLMGIGWMLYKNQTEKRQELAQNERIFTDFFSADFKPAPTVPPDPDRLAASPNNRQLGPDSVRLHAAVEALQREELQPTIRELVALSTGKPGHWSASAQWYLALAYLRNNQRAEARPLLQTIAQQTGHPYQQEAQRLLNQLTPSAPTDRP